MNRYSIFLFLALACANMQAVQINEAQAAAIAEKYMPQKQGRTLRPAKIAANADAQGQTGGAAYYAFNFGESDGFIIISGDDALTEVVGYSYDGHFDESDMPANLKQWLSDYSEYVRLVRSSELAAEKTVLREEASAVVSPLVTSKWNQLAPYNDMCPYDDYYEMRTVTGCVATAMAQIMNYWEWPKSGVGSKTYNSYYYGYLSVDFSKSVYDWDNMKDEYTSYYDDKSTLINEWTEEEAAAVAKLMYDCGVAVEMVYNVSASGALDGNTLYAFANYFGYNTGFYPREAFSSQEFVDFIKNEMNHKRPVLFCGTGTGGGHAFVVDGYDTNDFVHVNWGWGGISDGYFNVNYMNPDALGTGGGTGGFVENQTLITNSPDETMAGSRNQFFLYLMTASDWTGGNGYVKADKSELTKGDALNIAMYGIGNPNMESYRGSLAIGIYKEDGTLAAAPSAIYTLPTALPAGMAWPSEISLRLMDELSGLEDGVYKLRPLSKENRGKYDDWQRVATQQAVKIRVSGEQIIIEEEDYELTYNGPIEVVADEVALGGQAQFLISLHNSSSIPAIGNLVCEVRKVDGGGRVARVQPSIVVYDGADGNAQANVTISSNAFTVGQSYQLVPVGFTDGTSDNRFTLEEYAYDPCMFTVVEQSGVGELAADAEINVYPNPTADVVTVSGAAEVMSIDVYSATGSFVKSAAGQQVDLSGCPAGIYILSVNTEAGAYRCRVVKK